MRRTVIKEADQITAWQRSHVWDGPTETFNGLATPIKRVALWPGYLPTAPSELPAFALPIGLDPYSHDPTIEGRRASSAPRPMQLAVYSSINEMKSHKERI